MTVDEALAVADCVGDEARTTLAAEVRLLRDTVKLRENNIKNNDEWWKRELSSLRHRHAEAVEKAFREGWLERGLLPDCGMPPLNSCNAAWDRSDARRALA